MPEMVLEGCTAEPLMSYLKALGVLRLVVEQADPQARGAWANGRFVLWSGLDAQALLTFFLEEYKPTPLVAPWGARSGFYPGSSESAARAALQAIREAKLARLQPFQEVLQEVQEILRDLQFTTKVRDADKLTLMRACRARLPDHVLPWLDATYLLTQDDRTFPPCSGPAEMRGAAVMCLASRSRWSPQSFGVNGTTPSPQRSFGPWRRAWSLIKRPATSPLGRQAEPMRPKALREIHTLIRGTTCSRLRGLVSGPAALHGASGHRPVAWRHFRLPYTPVR